MSGLWPFKKIAGRAEELDSQGIPLDDLTIYFSRIKLFHVLIKVWFVWSYEPVSSLWVYVLIRPNHI